MDRKLFLHVCIVFIYIVTGCLPASPTSARDGDSGIVDMTASASDGNSGIRGTTRAIVVSGVPGGPTTGGLASVEFAIAPVKAGETIYTQAIFVKSDAQGMFKVDLPPGNYWIGPKAKALDPTEYAPGSVVFSEMVVEVKVGTFVSVELVETGYAP
jgi:hypothetical protein